MRTRGLHQILGGALLSLFATLLPLQTAYACTRAVYLGPEDTIITVRSMDWGSAEIFTFLAATVSVPR